jgi:hypothetical protein
MSRHRKWGTFVEMVRRACEELFPGVGKYDRAVFARVVSVSQLAGSVSEAMKLWSCTLEILGPDLKPDRSRAPIKDVPVDPIQINGLGQAMFPKPFPGLVVRLSWMYGRRDLPYIVSFTAEGQSVPLGAVGELSDLLYQAIVLLSAPQTTAVGPTAQVPPVPVLLEELKKRIPI